MSKDDIAAAKKAAEKKADAAAVGSENAADETGDAGSKSDAEHSAEQQDSPAGDGVA